MAGDADGDGGGVEQIDDGVGVEQIDDATLGAEQGEIEEVREVNLGAEQGEMEVQEVNLVETEGDKVEWLVSVVGCGEEEARRALAAGGGDISDALDHLETFTKQEDTRDVIDITDDQHHGSPAKKAKIEPQQQILSCLSWNIDGLSHRAISERFRGVINEIKQRKPTVVMLQEVIEQHVPVLMDCLTSTYRLYLGDTGAPYFNVLLIRSTEDSPVEPAVLGGGGNQGEEMKPFPGSTMGRHLLSVPCRVRGKSDATFLLMTSHLESLAPNGLERQSQLDQVLKRMYSGNSCALFGGDTNLRDKEYSQRSSQYPVQDVWEACGGAPDTRYTWDMSRNTNLRESAPSNRARLRFDRLLLRGEGRIVPVSFELVGQERLVSCDMFPSDHWGILATFQIN